MKDVDVSVARALCRGSQPASVLPVAPPTTKLTCAQTGYISHLHAGQIGQACFLLGAGRQAPGDTVGWADVIESK